MKQNDFEKFEAALEIVSQLFQSKSKSNDPLLRICVPTDVILSVEEHQAIEYLEELTPNSLFGLQDAFPKIASNDETSQYLETSDFEELDELPQSRVPSYALIESFCNELTQREIRILIGRILEVPAESLDSIGREFGVTRERVRQIESKLVANLTDWFTNDELVAEYSNEIRSVVGNFARLDELTSKIPDLNIQIPGLGLPTWYVFDKFDDSFESDGTWVAVPSLAEVARDFDELFKEYCAEGEYLDLEQLEQLCSDWGNATFNEIVQWALSRGYQQVGRALVSPNIRSMNDLAFVALSLADQSLSAEELHKIVAEDKSFRSFTNALAFDPRMHRVGNDNWALVSWGGHEYVGIKQEILNQVDVHGSVSLAALLAELPEKFGVSVNSVRTYATSWPLQTRGDEVSRAVKPVTPSRPLNRSKRVYFLGDGIAYRVLVNSEHLRGSGFPLPSALAGALGVAAGALKTFTVNGSQNSFIIRWPGAQPQASSIRSLLLENEITEGTEIALRFLDGEVFFNIVDVDFTDYSERIRALCMMEEGAAVNRKTIAVSLGLPSTSLWHEILELAELRREPELIEALAAFTANLES